MKKNIFYQLVFFAAILATVTLKSVDKFEECKTEHTKCLKSCKKTIGYDQTCLTKNKCSDNFTTCVEKADKDCIHDCNIAACKVDCTRNYKKNASLLGTCNAKCDQCGIACTNKQKEALKTITNK